jgi:hypothetical protein
MWYQQLTFNSFLHHIYMWLVIISYGVNTIKLIIKEFCRIKLIKNIEINMFCINFYFFKI